MKDENKTKEELVSELNELRSRIAYLENREANCKTVERKLEEQLHFLQTVIDSIPNPIFFKDAKGYFLDCNKAFAKHLGLSKEDIVGKTSYDLFPKEFADNYRQLDLISFSNPDQQVFETTLLYGDGATRDVIIYKGTFKDAEGQLAGLVGVTVDITERKRAEEALRKAHDELEIRVAERTAELASANEELRSEIIERKKAEDALRESSEKIKLFAYSVAHDLKSPTIGIHGLTKRLADKHRSVLDEQGKKYCDQILRASENVVALVEKVNAYAATRHSLLVVEKVDPEEVLHMVKEELATRMSMRRVEWSEPSNMPEIKADRLSLLRVFRNLVDNALKYGGERLSKISIGFQETDQFYIFSVADDGVGVRVEDSQRIFELFERNKGSQGVEGTGLGLAIVKEIAEQHGGRVWVDSGMERGATFYVSISKRLD